MQEQSGRTNGHSKCTRIYTKDGQMMEPEDKIVLLHTDSRITLQLLQNKKNIQNS